MPIIKSKDENVWKTIFSSTITYIFRNEMQFALLLVIALLAITPIVKDHMLIVMPVAMVFVVLIWGYLYLKK